MAGKMALYGVREFRLSPPLSSATAVAKLTLFFDSLKIPSEELSSP